MACQCGPGYCKGASDSTLLCLKAKLNFASAAMSGGAADGGNIRSWQMLATSTQTFQQRAVSVVRSVQRPAACRLISWYGATAPLLAILLNMVLTAVGCISGRHQGLMPCVLHA